MMRWTLSVPIVVAMLAVSAVGPATLVRGDTTPQAPPGPIIAHQPGAQLVYEGSREDVTVHVLEPREVRDAGWQPVLGVPLAIVQGGGDPTPNSPIVVEAVDAGGLLVKGLYCDLYDDVECTDGGLGVSWQHCPLWAAWTAPFNTVTGEQINDPPVTIQDPVRGLSWTYDVSWESADRVRLTVQDDPPKSTYCNPMDEAVIDVDSRLLVERSEGGRGNTSYELTQVLPGHGDPIPIGEGNLSAPTFVPRDEGRTEVYPPGAGSLGPEAWTIEAAWDKARENESVRAFLEENPDAFLADASRGAGHTLFLGSVYEQSRYEWDLELVGTSTEAIRVNTTKTVTSIGPVDRTEYEIETASAQPPEDAEPGFQPPIDQAANLSRFAEEADRHGFETQDAEGLDSTGDLEPSFNARVDPDRQVAVNTYTLYLEEGGEAGWPSYLIQTDAGRLFQLTASEEVRERVFQIGASG